MEGNEGLEILLVDDTGHDLELLRRLFIHSGRRVCCAQSAGEALRLINERPFPVMVTDLNMPGMNGIELTQKAREIAPDMVVILCTGSCLSDIAESAREAGISAIVRKPLKMHELLGHVAAALWQAKIDAGG